MNFLKKKTKKMRKTEEKVGKNIKEEEKAKKSQEIFELTRSEPFEKPAHR